MDVVWTARAEEVVLEIWKSRGGNPRLGFRILGGHGVGPRNMPLQQTPSPRVGSGVGCIPHHFLPESRILTGTHTHFGVG